MSIDALKAFLYEMDSQNAALGYFITLYRKETRSWHRMVADMKTADVSRNILPRVQLWSIKEYFDGRLSKMVTMKDPYLQNRIIQPTIR